MKKFIYTSLSLLVLFTGCKQETPQTLEPEKPTVIDHGPKAESIVFKNHKGFGIVINKTIPVFDDNLTETGKLTFDRLEKVQLTAVTKAMYNLKGSSEYCDKANFVKILHKGRPYTVFGKDVYEIDAQQTFPFQNPQGETFAVFSAAHFEMGASDEDGLTDCDEYSILVVENKNANTYILIGYPANENIHNRHDLKKAVLFNDDGSSEEIYSVTATRDTVSIGIKATYQEGGSACKLNTAFKDNFSKSVISGFQRYEEDELDRLKELK